MICKRLYEEYRVINIKSKTVVLKESLSDLARLFFKSIGVIGVVGVRDETYGVTYVVTGSDLYED